MIAIVNINSERFSFNGIPYYKNFMGIVGGDYVHIVNIYDSKIALTKDGPVKYDEITVNGNSFASAVLLQSALLPVLYTRGTLGGGGGVGNLQQVTENNNETDRGIIFVSEFGDKVKASCEGDRFFSLWKIDGISQSPIASIGSFGITLQDALRSLILRFPPTGSAQYVFPPNTNEELIASQDWASSEINNQILQLIDGAPIDANTLKRLNDKILAIQAIINGTNPDGDSIVNTIAELLAVFQNYPEGADIAQILADKVNVGDVVNNLTTLIAGKVLDARQGKALADLIAAKWTAVDATSVVKGIMKLYSTAGDNADGTISQKFFNDTVLAKKGIENANYQILATDKWVYTLGNFSANRTFTLPGDAPQGKEIIVADEQGTVGAFTLTIAAPTGKKLNGLTNGTEVIQSAYGWRRFVSDGDGNWFFDAGIVRQSQFNNALALKMNLENWVDHSSLSTINGFSALNTVVIKYIPIGKSFMYYFFVSGISNGPNFTFTIHTNHLGSTYFTGGGLNRNGGNLSNNAPRITLTSNSATISVLNTLAGSTWSGAGTKEASGWFIVESN